MKKNELRELQDDDLKREKLISEIRDLNKPLWKQHYFYTLLATFFVLFFGSLGGFFNWDKFQLQKQIIKMDNEIINKQKELDSIDSTLYSIKKSNLLLEQQRDSAVNLSAPGMILH